MGSAIGPGGSNPFDFESTAGGSGPIDEPTQPTETQPASGAGHFGSWPTSAATAPDPAASGTDPFRTGTDPFGASPGSFHAGPATAGASVTPQPSPPRPVPGQIRSVPIERTPRATSGNRGQPMSWVALALAVVMSVLVGYTAFRSLVAIDVVSDNPLGSAFNWLTLLVVAVAGVFVALIIAVIAVFKARPRLVATLALIIAVVLPWITLLVGLKFGAEIFVLRAQRELAVSGSQVAGAVIQTLSEKGVDLGPFREVLERLLR